MDFMHIWTFVIYPLPKIMLHLALGDYIRNSIEIVIHEFPYATTYGKFVSIQMMTSKYFRMKQLALDVL